MESAEWLWHCLWPLGSSSDFSEPQLCICKKTDLVILKLSLNSENVWFEKTAFKEYLNTPPPSTAPQTILLDQFQRLNVNKNILFPTSISSETGFFRLSNNGKGGLQYLATTKKKIIIVLNQQMLCSPLNRSWLFLGKGKCNKERWKNSRGRHNHNQREQKQNPGIDQWVPGSSETVWKWATVRWEQTFSDCIWETAGENGLHFISASASR